MVNQAALGILRVVGSDENEPVLRPLHPRRGAFDPDHYEAAHTEPVEGLRRSSSPVVAGQTSHMKPTLRQVIGQGPGDHERRHAPSAIEAVRTTAAWRQNPCHPPERAGEESGDEER